MRSWLFLEVSSCAWFWRLDATRNFRLLVSASDILRVSLWISSFLWARRVTFEKRMRIDGRISGWVRSVVIGIIISNVLRRLITCLVFKYI